MPAAQGWNVVRHADQNGTWEVHGVATLDEAAALLQSEDNFVFALPLSAVLAQRLQLPTVEQDEFGEMVRIQIEKALPYAADEVTSGYEVVEQMENGSVISAVAVHNEKLSELALPFTSRGLFPSQVTVYANQRAATHAREGTVLFIYPEPEAVVCAISEEGKVTFTRTLEGADAMMLHRDLSQLTLSAELQGIDTTFPSILLDESLHEWRGTVQDLFATRTDLIGVEAPPARSGLNLLPESWRHRRAQLARLIEWRKRLLWAGGAYLGILLLVFAYLGVLKLQNHRMQRNVSRDAPKIEFVKSAEARWKALSPAIDRSYYPIEVLLNLYNSLPSADVHITAFNQSARQISVDGEANSAALAYQFVDKVKKNPELKTFQFDMGAPRILPNDHAQFRLEGKPR